MLLKDKTKWAHYDVSHFPDVKVSLGRKIRNDEEFQSFLNEWENLYSRNQKFTLYFDATQVGMVSIKYCFKMRNFIRTIKERHPSLLERSYIRVNSRWVRFLLSMIFAMEKPVAPVHLHTGNYTEPNVIASYNP